MEGFKLLQKLKIKKSYFYKSNMESTTIHQTDILNRAQLQEALNMFYTTAMSYCPHDETVFRNGAELLMKAINQCAPVSEHNANGVTYDCVYDESSPRLLEPSCASPTEVEPETQPTFLLLLNFQMFCLFRHKMTLGLYSFFQQLFESLNHVRQYQLRKILYNHQFF